MGSHSSSTTTSEKSVSLLETMSLLWSNKNNTRSLAGFLLGSHEGAQVTSKCYLFLFLFFK